MKPQFDELKQNQSAQMTVVGLLLLFLTVTVFAILLPHIVTSVDDMAVNLTNNNNSDYSAEIMLVRLIPAFFIVTLLSSIALYGAPQL